MLRRIFAALVALVPVTALAAQATTVPATDFRSAPVLPGTWSYHPLPGASEARFVDTTGTARLVIHCTRATRRVGISPTSGVPAPTIAVWTSVAMRSLPARFEANAMRVTAELPAFDPLLDAIAFSRGRIALTLAGGTSLAVPALVLPSGPEAARTVEDCRN